MILVQDVLLTSILFISAMYVYKHLACNFLSITNESSDSKKIDERVFTRKKKLTATFKYDMDRENENMHVSKIRTKNKQTTENEEYITTLNLMFSISNKMQFIRLQLNLMAREEIFTRREFLPEFSTLTLNGCIKLCLISSISISQVHRFEKILFAVFHVFRFFR